VIGGALKPISILVVDDSVVFLRTVKIFLEQLDYVQVVGTACGGEEGLEKAVALRPDIVLLDLSMPDLGGLEVIPKVRAASAGARIIALTMLDEDGYREVSLAAGAHEFISKATMHTDLPAAIYRLAGRDDPSEKRGTDV
jgi:DNA-binding NarL/FixJ family response regulator